MTHGHVPVGGQHHQEQRARDLIDGGGGEVDLAHGHAEGPLSQCHGRDQKRNSHQETLISHSEMKNISVGNCVHFREPGSRIDEGNPEILV